MNWLNKVQENVTTTSFLSDMICCHRCQIVALKLISTVIFDTLAAAEITDLT